MALSYYSNWDACQQLISDAQTHETNNEQLMSWELQDFSLLDNHAFDSDNLFYSSDNNNSLVPHFLTPISNDVNLSNCAVPFQEFDPCPKRQKAAYIDYEEIYPWPCALIYNGIQDYNSQEVVMPDFPPVYKGDRMMRYESGTKKSLSAQSIAARQRRRKISNKTQELGKLIPGGHKMNTAEMFHAAYKYIKFLQAQVGILQSMEESYHGDHKCDEEYLHGLVECPLIQEKLYSTEKCLVPSKFVEQ